MAESFADSVFSIYHFFVVFVLTTGGIWLPVIYLPCYILIALVGLARYHDFCWMTRATEIMRGAGEMYGKKKYRFIDELKEKFPEFVPTELTNKLAAQLFTAFTGAACAISLYRLSKHYKFHMVPNEFARRLLVAAMIPWVLVELYVMFHSAEPTGVETTPIHREIVFFTPVV
jgi:hypothetical protein